MAGTFVTVICPGCEHEQTLFGRASTDVHCVECETTLAEPTGGKARLHGEIVEEL